MSEHTAEQLDAGMSEPSSPPSDPTATADLASRLGELRALPGFPEASDDALLAISRPRGYTACPNPYGADVVPSSAPVDRREPTPYATDITVGKGDQVYKAHSYPTKVPHEAIMRFVLHYTEPGDLVLDGFCGSGMAGVAVQACGQPDPAARARIEAEMPYIRWGARRAFLQDLAPNATFLAAGLNLPVDSAAFDRASRDLLNRFDREWGWMYETTAPDGTPAVIDYVVWSEVFGCPHCAGRVVFYDVAFDAVSETVGDNFRLPDVRGRVDEAPAHEASGVAQDRGGGRARPGRLPARPDLLACREPLGYEATRWGRPRRAPAGVGLRRQGTFLRRRSRSGAWCMARDSRRRGSRTSTTCGVTARCWHWPLSGATPTRSRTHPSERPVVLDRAGPLGLCPG